MYSVSIPTFSNIVSHGKLLTQEAKVWHYISTGFNYEILKPENQIARVESNPCQNTDKLGKC